MCDLSDVIRPEQPEILYPESPTLLAEAGRAFAVDLWGQIGDIPGNLAVSPASLRLGLSMTLAGARGATLDEMTRTLHLRGRTTIHEAAANQLYRWNDPDLRGCELRAINRLFGERAHTIEEGFQALVRARYGAPLELLDFKHRPEASRVRINRWVSERTGGRIQNLLPAVASEHETSLILVNIIYFLGKWACPFGSQDTREALFRTPGNEFPVPTMHQTRDFPYFENRHMKILEMPYERGEFAMTVLLPHRMDDLPAIEDRLLPRALGPWLEERHLRPVNVAIPSFTIDPHDSIHLKPALVAMGMPSAFDSRTADFTGISRSTDPGERLFLEDVVHKAFVRVDEAGTVAAAATAAREVRLGISKPQEPRDFFADHPFLFLIRDVRTGMILFMGRVTDPRN